MTNVDCPLEAAAGEQIGLWIKEAKTSNLSTRFQAQALLAGLDIEKIRAIDKTGSTTHAEKLANYLARITAPVAKTANLIGLCTYPTYSTVTLFAKFLGRSTSVPFSTAT